MHARIQDEIVRFGRLQGWFAYLDVHNGRPDTAALETTARLVAVRANGVRIDHVVRSPQKAAGLADFAHVIFPGSHESFDVLCVGTSDDGDGREHVYLASALDLTPLPAVPVT